MSALASNLPGSAIDLFVFVIFTGILEPFFRCGNRLIVQTDHGSHAISCQPLRGRSDLQISYRRDKIVIQKKTGFRYEKF